MDDLEGRDREAPLISTALIVAVMCVAVVTGACSASSSRGDAGRLRQSDARPSGRAGVAAGAEARALSRWERRSGSGSSRRIPH